jgi:hypothetical protein
LLIKQRTQLMNSLRAMLAEFGVVAAQGYRGLAALRAHWRTKPQGFRRRWRRRCGVWRRNSTP